MKHLSIFLALGLMMSFCLSTMAQTYELTPVGMGLSGGELQTEHAILQHSIGEPMTETWQISAHELRQGFQQSVEGYVTSIASEKYFSQLHTYPQPAQEQLTIAWEGTNPLILRLSWWDISGKSVENSSVQAIYLLPGEKTQLSLQDLAAGTYLLLAEDENGTRLSAWPVIKLP